MLLLSLLPYVTWQPMTVDTYLLSSDNPLIEVKMPAHTKDLPHRCYYPDQMDQDSYPSRPPETIFIRMAQIGQEAQAYYALNQGQVLNGKAQTRLVSSNAVHSPLPLLPSN